MPAHFGEIRPCGLTLVISHMTRPAQPSEKLPRCIRCQSLAEPLSELYWHIGDTTTRLGRMRPRSVIGENRTLVIFGDPSVRDDQCQSTGPDFAEMRWHVVR